jgi:hypothetical protein
VIPITPEQLRKQVKGWPVGELRQAIAAALPELDDGLVAVVVRWPAASRAIVPSLVDPPVVLQPDGGSLYRGDSVAERRP